MVLRTHLFVYIELMQVSVLLEIQSEFVDCDCTDIEWTYVQVQNKYILSLCLIYMGNFKLPI
jgi:hypothetical protein